MAERDERDEMGTQIYDHGNSRSCRSEVICILSAGCDMPIHHFGLPPLRSNFSNIARIYSAALALKQIAHAYVGRTQAVPADGDRLQIFSISQGTETKLEISTWGTNASGIWDLYINGVLDSSGYDDYVADAVDIHREITLTQQIQSGLNTIELRVNGKNVDSAGYNIFVYGASLQ